MSTYPRYQAEYWIQQNINELALFRNAFQTRIARAFDGLEEEANVLAQSEFDRMGAQVRDGDMGDVADSATNLAITFFTNSESVRDGVYNLMIAGIYHYFEQHTNRLIDHLPKCTTSWKSSVPRNQLCQIATQENVNIRDFDTWELLDELRLVANTVKHGEGNSADDLVSKYPNLIDSPLELSRHVSTLGLDPLFGGRLRLSEDQFYRYADGVAKFWSDLAEAFYTVFCKTNRERKMGQSNDS